MGLDKQQKAIVESKSDNILVVAGAGSGKTRVLTERVRYLINEMGVEPSGIVCITFTNMASQEMKQRLADIPTIGDAFIGTIHSFANTIYKGSGMDYKILNTEVELEIYRELLEGRQMTRGFSSRGDSNPYGITYKKLLQYFDMMQLMELGKISEEEVQNFLMPSEQDGVRALKDKLYKICKERNILTFDELLEKTIAYYATIGGHIEYVLVDEFQDVGRLEHKFVMGLDADHTFLVGDDWQSIYGFKGGDVRIFKNLMTDPRFSVYYLENNYRNAGEIISLAERVINQVSSKIDKRVNVMRMDAEGDVSINTKEHVKAYLNDIKKSKKYGEWFILTRSNKEILELQTLLEEMKIPYTGFKRAGMTFDQMKELMATDTVKLLTVHVSKGLENKNVILYGNFPIKCPSYLLNEDERKVMYVGVTRAEDRLVILN